MRAANSAEVRIDMTHYWPSHLYVMVSRPPRVIQNIAAQAAIDILAMLCQMSCHKAKSGLSHGCLFHKTGFIV